MTTRYSRNWGRIGFVGAAIAMALVAVIALLLSWEVWVVWTIYIALGIIPTTLFISTYWWKVPVWSRSIEGRHMMALSSLLLALMVEQFVISVWGNWPGHDTFIAVVVAGIVLTMWQRYTMLLMAQRERDGELVEDTSPRGTLRKTREAT